MGKDGRGDDDNQVMFIQTQADTDDHVIRLYIPPAHILSFLARQPNIMQPRSSQVAEQVDAS